jgi:bifunctional DNA-binding transcriptional regulator/antitoxin component of YhaV-PrlF toxin-antitoxin module
VRFTTTIELGGKTATGLRVPAEVVEALGTGKRPPVTVTVNGHTYRSTVAAYSGDYFLPLAAEHRTAAGVAAGDTVEVDVELDTAPRVVEVPADLAAALDAEPEARRRFDALSYSHQRRHVLAVEGAKAAATRERRVAAAVAALLAG